MLKWGVFYFYGKEGWTIVVDFSKLDLHETPILILKNIDGTELQTLGYAKNVALELHFNEISTLTFDLPEFVDGAATPHYDDVAGMRIIELVGIGQFKLVDPSETKDGVKTIKSCKAYSLEYEFNEKKISLTEDTYELTDGLTETDTILGMILEKMPSWHKGTISTSLVGKYRTFDTSSQSVYDFMKSTLQEKFRCVFDFDTYRRTINIVDVDDFVPTQGVYLSLDNLLKKIEVSENSDNIVTCLGVYGAEGVDIYSVNPIGTDKIYNLDYLFQSGQIAEPALPLQASDDSFGAKWRRWEQAVAANQKRFYQLTVEQAIYSSNAAAQDAVLLRLDGEMTGLEALKATYVSAIAQGLEKDAASGRPFSTDLLPEVNQKITAKQAEIDTAKQQKTLSEANAKNAQDALKQIHTSCKFDTYFTDYVCPVCGGVAKDEGNGTVRCKQCGTVSDLDIAVSELLLLDRYFREDTMEDSSFVERVARANNENDRSGTVGTVSIKITDSNITESKATDVSKNTYTISGGKLTLSSQSGGTATTFTTAKIRSAAIVHNTDTNSFVMTAYLGAGYVGTDVMECGNVTISGTWSNSSGDLHVDPDVQDTNYLIGSKVTVSAANAVWYFTTDASTYESLSISYDLYQYGQECLKKLAFPSYTFSVDSGNFLTMSAFDAFREQLVLGRRIYLDMDDGDILEPICIGATVNYDDLASLTLEFSDTYSGGDHAMSLAGLLEESVSMGKTVSSSKNGWGAYQDSGANNAVRDFLTSALDVAKNKVLSSTMQAISWDESGIRLRKWKDSTRTAYEDTQIWMTDQNIVFTDDNWATAKMAIGKFHTTKYGDVFGIGAPYLVGNILAGERMAITNRNGNFLIDENGIRINGLNFFISSGNVGESDEAVPISSYVSDAIDESVGAALGEITEKDASGNVFVKADKLSGIINAVQNQMVACNSNMLIDGNGMWLIDTDKPSTATKAVWLNQSGMLLSKLRTSSNTSDPSYNSTTRKSFTWKTAITADGIAADYLVGEHLHGAFDISAGTPTTTGVYSTCPFYVDANGNMVATKATVKGDIDASDIKLDGSSVKSKLWYLTNALTDVASGGTSQNYNLDLELAGGGLRITGASTAGYATELYSGGALRMLASTGAVYIATSSTNPAAYIQLRQDGTIAFKATSVEGLNTTAVFG